MPTSKVRLIQQSGLSIYDTLNDRVDLFLANEELEIILNRELAGVDLNYPIRTRSKVAKSLICEAIGYPVPKSFKKTQPRFPGQNFDTYVQKADNLQIWNEEVTPSRRYVLIRVDPQSIVTCVRVVSGEALSDLDTTGTLTRKYQAKSTHKVTESVLVADSDTLHAQKQFALGHPEGVLPIETLFERLRTLVGRSVPNVGVDQERNRGAELHRLVCEHLACKSKSDSGQFPDVPEQLLELKLQTAPTIDLGLVCPDDESPMSESPNLRHSDTRYAIFYGDAQGESVILNQVVLTTGERFFDFFRLFSGLTLNKKLQIPLPKGFFA